MYEGIGVWETDGGATPVEPWSTAEEIAEPGGSSALAGLAEAERKLLGTGDQVDWAEHIRVRVSADLHRLARALELTAGRHGERDREYIYAVIEILEDTRRRDGEGRGRLLHQQLAGVARSSAADDRSGSSLPGHESQDGHEIAMRVPGCAAPAVGKVPLDVQVGDRILFGKYSGTGYYNLERMLKIVASKGGKIGVCGSCMDARGIKAEALTQGAHRSSMDELTCWTKEADKVLIF